MKKPAMITVDGSAGEGGGQILRTSLALALVTGKPFRMVNIRAGRKKPGLLRQHMTCVQAATEIGDAVTDGAEMGSTEIVFRPERIRAGAYHFAVGTAGSTTLVLQTILPALILAEASSTVSLEGGTHNPLAPPFDFLVHAFLPVLTRFGPQVEASMIRPGFYPAGGGRIEITIAPTPKLQPVDLLTRGENGPRRLVAHLSALPPHLAERAFARFAKRLSWEPSVFEIIEHSDGRGPGFALSAHVISANVHEIFTGFGEKGVRSEEVADALVDAIRDYLKGDAPVGEYLADQILLPMALAGGGVFRTARLSLHARTNISVIEQFLPVTFAISEPSQQGVEVSVAPRDC